MFCKKCGSENSNSAKFCKSCGSSIGVSGQTIQADNSEIYSENNQKSAWDFYVTVLKKYAVFDGRAQRAEYWYFFLFNAIFGGVAMILDNNLGTTIAGSVYGLFYILCLLVIFLPGLGVTVRRLHDIGKSGWIYWIALIPLIGPIWLFVLLATDSNQGNNQYGPNPKLQNQKLNNGITILLVGVVIIGGIAWGIIYGQQMMSANLFLGGGVSSLSGQTQSEMPTPADRYPATQEPATDQSPTTPDQTITTPASTADAVADQQPSAPASTAGTVTDSSCGTSTVQDSTGNTYGTVLAEDGNCWLDRNLGATEVATSITDQSAYGWYFQWGRSADGHQISTSGTTKTLSTTDNSGNAKFIKTSNSPNDWRSSQNDNLWQGVDGINNPCPAGFRLPTQQEWVAEISAANITNDNSAFNSALKMTDAGFRYYNDAHLNLQDSYGYYWSSTPTDTFAYSMYFDSSEVNSALAHERADGFSVRCIKD